MYRSIKRWYWRGTWGSPGPTFAIYLSIAVPNTTSWHSLFESPLGLHDQLLYNLVAYRPFQSESKISSGTYKYWTSILLSVPHLEPFRQHCSNFSVNMNHLRILIKCKCWCCLGLKFCKSNQLPNDADAAGPWTSLSSKAITLNFLPRSNYLQT